MTIPSTITHAIETIARLGLVPQEVAESLSAEIQTYSHAFDNLGLNRLLVRAGLTPFQARIVLNGQAERLVFGNYVLLDKVGVGGMGVVYKARHARLGRIDAVKVIRSEKIATKTLIKRFLREIELTARLEHPNIVRAYDAGIIGKQIYLATEYVYGTNLARLVSTDGPLPVTAACTILRQVATALEHIHDKGLVHRDLKPSNLILENATGNVKILDLGLSRLNTVDCDEQKGQILTRTGVLLGTPDYIAPEQILNPNVLPQLCTSTCVTTPKRWDTSI